MREVELGGFAVRIHSRKKQLEYIISGSLVISQAWKDQQFWSKAKAPSVSTSSKPFWISHHPRFEYRSVALSDYFQDHATGRIHVSWYILSAVLASIKKEIGKHQEAANRWASHHLTAANYCIEPKPVSRNVWCSFSGQCKHSCRFRLSYYIMLHLFQGLYNDNFLIQLVWAANHLWPWVGSLCRCWSNFRPRHRRSCCWKPLKMLNCDQRLSLMLSSWDAWNMVVWF